MRGESRPSLWDPQGPLGLCGHPPAAPAAPAGRLGFPLSSAQSLTLSEEVWCPGPGRRVPSFCFARVSADLPRGAQCPSRLPGQPFPVETPRPRPAASLSRPPAALPARQTLETLQPALPACEVRMLPRARFPPLPRRGTPSSGRWSPGRVSRCPGSGRRCPSEGSQPAGATPPPRSPCPSAYECMDVINVFSLNPTLIKTPTQNHRVIQVLNISKLCE